MSLFDHIHSLGRPRTRATVSS